MSFKIFGLNFSGLLRAVSFFLLSLVALNFLSPAGIDSTSEMEPPQRYERRAKTLQRAMNIIIFTRIATC